MEEVWKAVAGYEGLYEVSNHGRVKSLDRTAARGAQTIRLKGGIKNPASDTYGYLQARMTKDGVGSLVLVHRMVAVAFVENPDRLPEVNHKDLDKTNNAQSNLEWSAHDDNISHAGRRGRMCGYFNRSKRVKLVPHKVAAIRLAVARGATHRGVAKAFGVSKTLVGNIALNQLWNPGILVTAPPLLVDSCMPMNGAAT